MKKILIGFGLIMIWLASSWSLFHQSMFQAHDYVHVARIVEMQTGLTEGQIPVRWSQNFGYGYGMPLFQFYGPFPYLVGAGLFSLGLSAMVVLKLLIMISSLFTAWGGYRLGSVFYGRAGGLLTAAALTLAPYRAVNIFVRGAISETWGIMAFPWILYGLTLLVKGKTKPGWWITTLSVAVLLLSHNLLSLLFMPMAGIFVFGLLIYQYFGHGLDKRIIINRALVILGSVVLAFGLSTFYVLPAFFEKGLTKVDDTILGGYFDFRLHFLYLRQYLLENWGFGGSVWGPEDDMSFFLGYGQLFALLGASILLMKDGFKKILSNNFSLKKVITHCSWHQFIGKLVLGLLAITLFMAIQKSSHIWEQVSILRYVQFPWRWLAIAIVFLGLMTGSFSYWIKSYSHRWLILSGLFIVIVLGNIGYFQPERYLDNPKQLYYTNQNRIRAEMSGILPDYIPKDLAEDLPVSFQLLSDQNEVLSAEILLDRMHEKLLTVEVDQSERIELNLAWYPNWQVELNGQVIDAIKTEAGLVSFEIPPGKHLVGVYLAPTSIRKTSDIITFLSMLIFLGFCLSSVANISKQSKDSR